MKLSKEYILNNLAREDLWTPGSKGTFTYGDWLITLKREDEHYKPFKFAVNGRKEVVSKAGTYETWGRRYISMEKAFLHILNHFNENANVKDKYDHIDFDVLSTIKDLPSSSFENPTITLNFGNIVSELENKNLRLLHIEDNPGLFVVDSKDNLYAIETYHAGGYLDRYIGEKQVISFEQIEHPVRNFEEWRKTYWDAAWVKDFIKRVVQKEYPNVKFGGVEILEYDQNAQEKWGDLVDVMSPQECADLFGKPVRCGDEIFMPEGKEEDGIKTPEGVSLEEKINRAAGKVNCTKETTSKEIKNER